MTSLSLSLPNSADISAAALENDILTSGQDGSDAPTMRVESEDGSEKDDDDDEEPGGETSVTPLADTQKTKKRRRKYPPIKIDLDQSTSLAKVIDDVAGTSVFHERATEGKRKRWWIFLWLG